MSASRRVLRGVALALWVVLVTTTAARAEPAPDARKDATLHPCQSVLSAAQVKRLHERFAALAGDCAYAGISTDGGLSVARWRTAKGETAQLQVAPSGCLHAPTVAGGQLDLRAVGLAERCPEVWAQVTPVAGLKRFAAQAVTSSGPPRETRSEPTPTRGPPGWWLWLGLALLLAAIALAIVERTKPTTTLWPAAWLGLVGAAAASASLGPAALAQSWLGLTLVATLGWAWSRHRAARLDEAPEQRQWTLTTAAVFATAWVIRALVEPGLANWYTDVLIPPDAPDGRFGAGAEVVQQALSWLGLYSADGWRWANVTFGAAGCAALVACARGLSLSPVAGLTAGLLLAVAPLHVRVSASPSEHVVGALLLLIGFAMCAGAIRRADRWRLLVGTMWLLAATLVRADSIFQAAALLAIAWAASPDWRLRPAVAAIAVLLMSWTAVLYVSVVVGSNHPTPGLQGHLDAAADLLSQLSVGFSAPHWLSPITLVGAALGWCWLLWRRRTLALVWLVALAAVFIGPGRLLAPDELLGGRYFIAVLGLLGLLAAAGVSALASTLRHARAIGLSAALVAAGATAWVCVDAYQVRYTFQDEAAFLGDVLDDLEPGCTVVSAPVRAITSEGDLDCCLLPERTPLPLQFPALQFRTLTLSETPADLHAGDGCVAYYQSAACSLADTERMRVHRPRARATVRSLCAAWRDAGDAIAERPVTPTLPHDVFGGQAPQVKLSRVQ